MDSVVDGTGGGEPPSSQPIGGTSKSWDDVSTLPGMATDDDPFDEADPPPPPPPTVLSWLLPLGLGGAALLVAQYRLLSTYSDLLLPIGAILIVIGLAKAFLAYQRLKHARALRAAAAEAEELAQNPRAFTPAELRPYDGKDPRRPLLLAIKGRVLDVREGSEYYGPSGPYKVMAGRDASKAFAMMSLKEEDAHPDLSGVDDDHLKILDDWYAKLTKKYPTVGRVAG